MAIIKGLPGVEVNIVVESKPLKEYADGDQEDDNNSLRRYVEAVTGKVFEVQLKFAKGTKVTRQAIIFQVFVDGEWQDAIIMRNEFFRRVDRVEYCRGRSLGKGRMQKFSFSELETVSDGRMRDDEVSRAHKLGKIEIRIYFVDLGPKKPTAVRDAFDANPSIISEKALKGKAMTHGVGYKAPESTSLTSVTTTANLDPHNKYYFTFAYHSLKALKSMLIIEPTPEPIPLEERDFDSLTREDVKELQRRARGRAQEETAAQEAIIKIKRERMDDNPRPRKAARPSAGSTQLEIDEAGEGFREASTVTLGRVEPEIIDLD